MLKQVIQRTRNFTNTDLFKTSLWNGLATLVKTLTGLVSNKIIAVYLGPSGIAILGQFGNFVAMAQSFASFGINSGITKYIAEYKNNESECRKILSTGLKITILATLITSFIILFGARYFSSSIFHTDKYINIFYIFAVTLLLFTLNGFFISVLNGYKEFKKIITINIISSFVGLTIAIILVIHYGVWGALIGIILSTTLIAFVTFILVSKSKWFHVQYFTKKFDWKSSKKLSQYTLMAFTSVFAVAYIQLMTRTYIINHLSIQDAGYWQGIIKISNIYMILITTTLSYYYLPRLSEIKGKNELKKEIFKGYKFILPLTIMISAIIFFLRGFIVDALFTQSFQPMKQLFLFQLLGNIFKIASWLLSFLMVAKAMTKTYIITEIIFGLSFYLFAIILLERHGIMGVTIAYCVNVFLYFVVMGIIFRKILFTT
ncbi:MAG: O-antigen translocase [Bacteroidales bacterium]|nr:O-antigen translocase [Bacteroidales bacterium]